MKTESTTRDWEVANALMSWFYSTSGEEAAEAVFPGRHPDYLAEKASLYQRSYTAFWGSLDLKNQERLIDIAMSEYRPCP